MRNRITAYYVLKYSITGICPFRNIIKNFRQRTFHHTIWCIQGAGATLARSAGSFAQLAGKDGGYAILKLQSGEIKKFPLECLATIGTVSNADNKNTTIGKAGRSRWLGIRPSVRGESMNPVDHPHGGRTRGGRIPVSPTGVQIPI